MASEKKRGLYVHHHIQATKHDNPRIGGLIMSEHTINQLHPSLKLNRRVEKLGRTIDQLDILIYRYKQLSLAYRQLALQCAELAETIDQTDVAAFEVRQDYTFVRAALHE